ncbi:3-ketoacyl-CoA synthase [Forsythia ovata]|uniref:3-ketoacyl-CoA synthase n=1 Tax=Forsythia ovata TaxID=205694 RepID=A0ABD1XAH5_9LAMI
MLRFKSCNDTSAQNDWQAPWWQSSLTDHFGPNYEIEDEPVAVNEDDNKNVNLDFGFSVLDGQKVRESDTYYSDFEELRSLDSKDEEGRTFRKRTRVDAFNPRIDIDELRFKTGKSFTNEISKEEFVELARKSYKFNEAVIQYQQHVIKNSSLGDETYLPRIVEKNGGLKAENGEKVAGTMDKFREDHGASFGIKRKLSFIAIGMVILEDAHTGSNSKEKEKKVLENASIEEGREMSPRERHSGKLFTVSSDLEMYPTLGAESFHKYLSSDSRSFLNEKEIEDWLLASLACSIRSAAAQLRSIVTFNELKKRVGKASEVASNTDEICEAFQRTTALAKSAKIAYQKIDRYLVEADGSITILTKKVDDVLNAQQVASSTLERANDDIRLLKEDASSRKFEVAKLEDDAVASEAEISKLNADLEISTKENEVAEACIFFRGAMLALTDWYFSTTSRQHCKACSAECQRRPIQYAIGIGLDRLVISTPSSHTSLK